MASEQIEFVDYIFDRYAYLDIDPNAAHSDIEARVKELRSQNHSDRLNHLSDALKAQAAVAWTEIDKCAEVLLNDELRPLFDERLAVFKTKHPHYVLKDSRTRIYDLNRDSVDIDYLTGDGQVDIAGLRQQSEAISGYSEKGVDRARKMYMRDTCDADLIATYREALHKKIIYLQVMDKYLWGAAGISGENYTQAKQTVMDTALIEEVVAQQIKHVKEEVIPAFVQERSGLLALGYDKKPLLLLTGGVSAKLPQTIVPEVASRIEKIQSRFAMLSEAIKFNALELAAAMSECLDLSPFEIIHASGVDVVNIHLIIDDNENYDLNAGKVILSWQFRKDGMDVIEGYNKMSVDDIRLSAKNETTVAILYDQHLNDPYLSLGYAYKKTLKHFGVEVELAVNNVKDNVGQDIEMQGDAERPEEIFRTENKNAPHV